MTNRQQHLDDVAARTRPQSTVWLVKLGSRGRLLLPLEIRNKYEIKQGDVLSIRHEEGGCHFEIHEPNLEGVNSRTGHRAGLPPTAE